ncbi:FHA domain-containing protein At4g14490 [Brassica rapa]|uniref:FHA domain-containing protein n=1 Tax=Brassica campestris TaxID=3711 RepID=M4DY67_BRACM|nr:FHA domain-containing protein At4g14490 [Brassica rapa]XP_013644599.3 FHA domain-containing protein At4g14490-like [Brassica napus]
MTPPLLKLAFVQGPRDGESLEYKPGSTIRIGRVVRGNEIAIKDAGISTKHLRIVSDSENWIIHDLGSSNGTILNSDTLDPDTPVNLGQGDVIKLGEYTSIVVSFETGVQVEEEEEEEHKLPPRPRRNNRRLPVADPDPDPVQEKPKRRGRPRKNETKEAVPVEKNAQGSKKNTEDVENLGLNPVKLEIEDIPKGVEISAVKRGTRSRQIRNVKCEDDVIEEEKRRPSRATRSTKKEIGGDSFQELERVLNQARKSRANKKKVESAVEEMEARNDVGEGKGCSEASDKENENVEQVEIDSRKSTMVGEEDLNCSVREDLETENFQEERDSKGEGGGVETSKMVEQVEIKSRNSAVVGEGGLDCSVRVDVETDNLEEEKDSKGEEGGVETSDGKAEQGSRNEKNVEKVDLEKMTLGDWFAYMKVHLRKQIVDETEKLIEDMRSKSLRVRHHIEEQKQAKGQGRSS